MSIVEYYGAEYTLDVSMDNDQFVLTDDEMTFNVSGCPIGYGVKSVNFTCSVCDTFTYNIEDEYVGECHSCDPDDNTGDVAMICSCHLLVT